MPGCAARGGVHRQQNQHWMLRHLRKSLLISSKNSGESYSIAAPLLLFGHLHVVASRPASSDGDWRGRSDQKACRSRCALWPG
jgi:hypothetical protein